MSEVKQLVFVKDPTRKTSKADKEKIMQIAKKHVEDLPLVDAKYAQEETKIVWQCWFQGLEKAPATVRHCLQSVENNLPVGYRRIILTEENYREYLEIPSFILEKYAQGLLSLAHFSDILRVNLLSQKGGIWIDATVFLSGQIQDEIIHADFFVYRNPDPNQLIKISNWFMLSKAGHPLIEMIKTALHEYLKKHTLKDYFIFHYLFSAGVEIPYYKAFFDTMPAYSSQIPHFMQYHFNEKYNPLALKAILELSPVHKLSYKENTVKTKMFFKSGLASAHTYKNKEINS